MHFFCMPTSTASKSTAAKPARKTRTRKPATPKARTRKAVAKPEPAKVVITPDSESVKRSYKKIEDAKVNLKSLKDYPRDGLSLILLPLLYLEAFTKELLPVIGRIKF